MSAGIYVPAVPDAHYLGGPSAPFQPHFVFLCEFQCFLCIEFMSSALQQAVAAIVLKDYTAGLLADVRTSHRSISLFFSLRPHCCRI